MPVILARFDWNVNFLDRFSKNTEISNFFNFVHWERILSVRSEGRTIKRDEAKCLFSQFCEGAKGESGSSASLTLASLNTDI
jgi:hypothetical protein